MKHEVAIVGGGLVGLALANALGQQGVRVALVEASAASPALPASGYDLRVSTLSLASRAWLDSLGSWALVDTSRIQAFESMVVWDAGSRGCIRFEAADLGLACLGVVAENLAVIHALEAGLALVDTVKCYRPERLQRIEVSAREVVLHLERTRLSASLLVGADGARSSVRKLAGIETAGGSFEQRALVTNFEAADGHRDTAWQRFLPGGPVALLPMPGQHVSLVWSLPTAEALQTEAAGAEALAEAVNVATEGRLGGLRPAGELQGFDLSHSHARQYVAPRIALVGDAAHAIHPLAGQGVNLGLLDGAVLTQALLALRQRGRDLGRYENLRSYERWRRGHNQAVGESMKLFHHLFTSKRGAAKFLRGAGLGFADRVGPLKRAFMRVATGTGGDLPAAMRLGRAGVAGGANDGSAG